MNKLNIIKKVVSRQTGISSLKISVSDRLVDDLGCDSLDVIEIVMDCEWALGELPVDFNPQTVRELYELYNQTD